MYTNFLGNPWEEEPKSTKPSPEKPGKFFENDFFNTKKQTTTGGGNFKFSGNNLGLDKNTAKLLLLLVFILWLLSGFCKIDSDEQGIVLRFGKYTRTFEAGLHYKIPYPIEKLAKIPVKRINKLNIGSGGNDTANAMLTADENIVDLNFEVQWKVKDAKSFLLNVRNNEQTIYNVAQSVMREVIATKNISDILSTGRSDIEISSKILMQEILDSYDIGIDIVLLQLLRVDPPSQVIDAFRDVQGARADYERKINEALAYTNSIIPKAHGEAEQILQESEAYKSKVTLEALGKSKRFSEVYQEYQTSKDATRRRLYIETMEQMLQNNDVIIIDDKAAKAGIIPYLNVDKTIEKKE